MREQASGRGERGWAAAAGCAAAVAALGAGELVAGLVDGAPSPVTAVGEVVIPWVPPAVEDAAIALFGTADKLALNAGIVLLTLIIGGAVGVAGARRFSAAAGWYGGFAALAAVAGLAQPSNPAALAVVTPVLAAGAGLAVLAWLYRLMRAPERGEARSAPVATEAALPVAGRRRLLIALAGTTAAAATAGIGGRALLAARRRTIAPVGLPSPARTVTRPGPGAAFDVEGLSPVITPNHDFYRIDTALVVPRVDPARWRLKVVGMVEREVELTLDDLHRMTIVEDHVTLSCVSNEVGGDLVGNARWTGVPLEEVLQRAGVLPGAQQIVGRSVDGWTAGFPTGLASDGRTALVALGMNGQPLPAAHGFPARLVVAGLYGYVSATKWLEEIELTTWDGFDAYWVPRGWAKEAPVKTQSRIDVPRHGRRVDAGQVVVAGVAWAPTRGISAVEVRADEGAWQPCEVAEPLGDSSWVQWRITVDLADGEHLLAVRATDGTGQVQTAERSRPRPDGATGHHTIRVSARA